MYTPSDQHLTVKTDQTSGPSWSIHSIFKPISGQTSIWNSKPANWDDHDQHSDFFRLGSIIYYVERVKWDWDVEMLHENLRVSRILKNPDTVNFLLIEVKGTCIFFWNNRILL